MSMLEVFKNHKAIENPEFGQKKKLVGDAVAQVQSIVKKTAKSGADWIIFKCEAIHAIPDPKGRETTIVPGDELTIVYDPTNAEAIADLSNDLFTAGIEVDAEDAVNDDDLIVRMDMAAKGKLVYFRTWCKDKTPKQIEESKPGKPPYYQNINIKSKNLITPENSTPELPF